MTFDQRVLALAPLRLTPRQTRFVVTVALHSGYCLRRQYMAFAGLHYGKVVREFLEHLVARRLAVRETCRADRGFLYHLHSRAIYRALDQEDNRNRRRASVAAIGRRLMLLDVVIAHADGEWYATEDDKVAFFTHRRGVPLADLPHQTYASFDAGSASTLRYFPHKWPICVTGEPPRVHFVALALEYTGQSCARFLQDHARLLAHLPAWTIVVAHQAGATAAADACRVAFDQFVNAAPPNPVHARADLVRLFVTRRAVERNDLASFSVADLNWYREARQRLAAPTVDALYAQWRVSGDHVLDVQPAPPSRRLASTGQFVARELPFAYEQFGDFAGVC
jgi:hypothetical protein